MYILAGILKYLNGNVGTVFAKTVLIFQSIKHVTLSKKAEEQIVVAHLGIVTAI